MPRQAGFSTFEFAVVLIILGGLAGLLFDRLAAVEQETERLEVSLTVRHINIGLKLAIGEHIIRGEEVKIAALLDENPLHFLGSQKVGAGGTADTPGNWHYTAASRTLSYWPRQPAAFDGQSRLDWHFNGHRDELGRMVGLRLAPAR